jgi:hypothetical protein
MTRAKNLIHAAETAGGSGPTEATRREFFHDLPQQLHPRRQRVAVGLDRLLRQATSLAAGVDHASSHQRSADTRPCADLLVACPKITDKGRTVIGPFLSKVMRTAGASH